MIMKLKLIALTTMVFFILITVFSFSSLGEETKITEEDIGKVKSAGLIMITYKEGDVSLWIEERYKNKIYNAYWESKGEGAVLTSWEFLRQYILPGSDIFGTNTINVYNVKFTKVKQERIEYSHFEDLKTVILSDKDYVEIGKAENQEEMVIQNQEEVKPLMVGLIHYRKIKGLFERYGDQLEAEIVFKCFFAEKVGYCYPVYGNLIILETDEKGFDLGRLITSIAIEKKEAKEIEKKINVLRDIRVYAPAELTFKLCGITKDCTDGMLRRDILKTRTSYDKMAVKAEYFDLYNICIKVERKKGTNDEVLSMYIGAGLQTYFYDTGKRFDAVLIKDVSLFVKNKGWERTINNLVINFNEMKVGIWFEDFPPTEFVTIDKEKKMVGDGYIYDSRPRLLGCILYEASDQQGIKGGYRPSNHIFYGFKIESDKIDYVIDEEQQLARLYSKDGKVTIYETEKPEKVIKILESLS